MSTLPRLFGGRPRTAFRGGAGDRGERSVHVFETMRCPLPLLAAISLFAFLAPNATADPPCVPDGGSLPVDFTNPEIPPDSYIGGAEAMEDDILFNDTIGDAQFDTQGGSAGGKTTFLIQNNGGTLSYGGTPDGENPGNNDALNGGSEGPCIEVYICWTVYQLVEITETKTGGSLGGAAVAPGLAGVADVGTSTTTTERRRDLRWYKVCSDTQDVCPCGENE